jgi:hypothetical protein
VSRSEPKKFGDELWEFSSFGGSRYKGKEESYILLESGEKA